MQSAPQPSSFRYKRKHTPIAISLGSTVVLWLCSGLFASAQMPQLPITNGGADPGFAQMDFARLYLESMNGRDKETDHRRAAERELVDSGAVSALDLAAPNNAIEQYNHARSMAIQQHSKEAIQHLQKAIKFYPKFVSAHIGLGLAYLDQEDTSDARSEFETAAKLDDKFPGSFLNLGLLSLSLKDFATAQQQLEKAASIQPRDTKILSTLAYAENATHQYQRSIETVQRVHALAHKGMANVHYVAAASALALKDNFVALNELTLFLREDPTNALAPVAQQNLDALIRKNSTRQSDPAVQTAAASSSPGLHTFPNSDRLKAQLTALSEPSDSGVCNSECGTPAESAAEPDAAEATVSGQPSANLFPGLSRHPDAAWTIRRSVDDVALFFAVSSHGHMIDDLQLSDIQIRDDNKPPAKVVQFAPQSKLPLRLALLVDTSGSVHDRFSFEKRAATKFVQTVLSGTADLGFVAGFSGDTTIMQDFSADKAALGSGIEKLANGGGTALFDAVSQACWKLAEYPDGERVARVLVILSDGEDNSSHGTLKQSIRDAEKTGVTIYTVSTKEDLGAKTDADRILAALAENSGGEAMFPGDSLSLGKSFDRLRELIRSRYFVAYKPADFHANGSYRTISVIAGRNGKHLQVRARKGYHTRLEASPN